MLLLTEVIHLHNPLLKEKRKKPTERPLGCAAAPSCGACGRRSRVRKPNFVQREGGLQQQSRGQAPCGWDPGTALLVGRQIPRCLHSGQEPHSRKGPADHLWGHTGAEMGGAWGCLTSAAGCSLGPTRAFPEHCLSMEPASRETPVTSKEGTQMQTDAFLGGLYPPFSLERSHSGKE